MKNSICLFIGVLLLFTIHAQTKYALVVAVGKYPEGQRYWRNLSSVNDWQHIKPALLQNGFGIKNIDTLINEKATKKNILLALDKLAAKAKAGDIIYFHFSGHGQQIQDDANDGYLDEVDGYDEALVPYDAKGVWDEVDYKGENHLRDDLLALKLNVIRKKVGKQGSVLVVVDACHSGTITRTAGIYRGTPQPLQRYNYVPNTVIDLSKQPENSFLNIAADSAGALIVISGSSPNQVNKETTDNNGKSVGALSYAFAKSIVGMPANTNYKMLFEKIKAYIQADEPTQIPMIEGNIGLHVFANNYTAVQDIIAVQQKFNNTTYGFSDTVFVINRGIYNNVLNGTTLTIHELGNTTVYCNAYVKEANYFQSICVSDKPLQKKTAYEAKIEKMSYNAVKVGVVIQNNNANKQIENQLKQFLLPQSFVQENNQPDFTIQLNNEWGKTKVELIEKNDSTRYQAFAAEQDTLSYDNLTAILENIKKGMRIKFLRKIEDGGSLAKFMEVKIVPQKPSENDNELVLYPYDDFTLQIKSNYDGILYYTILDLLPDNEVKVLIPDTLKDAGDADYSLRKGQLKEIPLYTDETSITGKEFMKIIVSPYPIDLRPSFYMQVVRSAAVKPLEKLMDDIFKHNRGTLTRSTPVKMDDIGIITVGFTLKKRTN